jgi:hypothetical protein
MVPSAQQYWQFVQQKVNDPNLPPEVRRQWAVLLDHMIKNPTARGMKKQWGTH